MPTNSSASALRDGTSRIAVCCRRHSLQLKHKWLRRHEPKWRSSAAVRPASQFRQAVVSRWDKFFVMDDPPDYEPAPEKSLATIAARSGRPPDEVAYDYITEADAYRYSVFGALSHGNSGANARWDHEGTPSTCRCPRVGCYRLIAARASLSRRSKWTGA
jgi:hypothetical protein